MWGSPQPLQGVTAVWMHKSWAGSRAGGVQFLSTVGHVLSSNSMGAAGNQGCEEPMEAQEGGRGETN